MDGHTHEYKLIYGVIKNLEEYLSKIESVLRPKNINMVDICVR
ncbi:hypothetical protein ACV3UL_14280 [Clostridium perfringens]